MAIEIDLGSRDQLTKEELSVLVTGVRAAVAEDRYAEVELHGRESCLRQVSLLTRWFSLDPDADPLQQIVTPVVTDG
jgi:hypothetical protein